MKRPAVRRLVFACVTATAAVTMSGLVLLGADLYAHHRAERTAGLNIWGYRGPVAPAKAAGEIRIALLGGSTVFGYGVSASEAIPAVVERTLRSNLGSAPPVSAVNLGYNNEGAYSFAFTLEDYAYLRPDVIVLYEGYNDLMGDPAAPNTAVYRHDSAVFRLTGYFPILPLVLHEKAMSLRAGGNLGAAYAQTREAKTVFTAPLADRTSAAALDSISRVTDSLGQQLGRLTETPSRKIGRTRAGCAYPWAEYCESVFAAVANARASGQTVAVVSQPRLTPPVAERHAGQQAALREMLARHYSGDPAVAYIDLSDAVDVTDPSLCYDGMHLTAAGNARLGAILARELIPLVRAARVER